MTKIQTENIREADLLLMVAAPDLLDALLGMLAVRKNPLCAETVAARAAVAKAIGRELDYGY